MNPVGQPRLTPSRLEKFDEAAIRKQISLIQEVCPDIDPNSIARVLHDCDYDSSTTISRLREEDLQDGGWQTARSSHKKKMTNTHPTDTITNGSDSNEGERSHVQRPSPTTGGRRENNAGGNTFVPFNPHRPTSRSEAPRKVLSNENVFAPSPSPITTPPVDHSAIQSPLTLDTVEKKTPAPSVHSQSSKHRVASSIPREPVVMHRTLQLPHEEVDIQFGDIQWKNSVAIAVTPSDPESTDDLAHGLQYYPHVPTNSSANQMSDTMTSELEASLAQVANQLSMGNDILSDNLPTMMSRQRASPLSTQYLTGEPINSQISTTDSLSTSASAATTATDFSSPISHVNNPFLSTPLQHPSHDPNLSAFVSFPTPGSYSSIASDYPQGALPWNPQPSSHQAPTKPSMVPTANYSHQALYQLPNQQQAQAQQQQQLFVAPYQYSTPSPTMLQVLMPMDSWQPNGYPASLDPYPYPQASYVPAYSTQPPFHPATKYEQQAYDSEFLGNYGQPRSTASDLSHARQSSSSSPQPQQQAVKEIARTSKLSATAATFSHGTSWASSSPTPAGYVAPFAFPVSAQYSSIDNRDNRYSVSYGGNNHRNNYYHPGQQQQQQRPYQNNTSNNNWHPQQ